MKTFISTRWASRSLLALSFIFFSIDAYADTAVNCSASKLPSIHCGEVPHGVLAQSGKAAHFVFELNDVVYYTATNDVGGRYSAPVAVNKVPEKVYTNGENRPKIALGTNGEIYVSWSKITEGRFNGDIRFSRSIDGGKSFEAVKTINDDGLVTGHRFDSMAVDTLGHIYLAWIDKRDKLAATKAGKDYAGAAIYYSVSKDAGKSFSRNMSLAQNSCECCRVASEANKEKGVTFFWRHIFAGSIRDHAIASVDVAASAPASVFRAGYDNWKIEACPHHGPALVRDVASKEDNMHLTWFSNGTKNSGVMYGYYDAKRKKTLKVKKIDPEASASHPDIAYLNEKAILAWKKSTDASTEIRFKTTQNNGLSWSSTSTIFSSKEKSDYPLFLHNKDQVLLGWKTKSRFHLDDLSSYFQHSVSSDKKLDVQLLELKGESFPTIEEGIGNENHVVLLWSIDCPPCLKDLKLVQELQAQYGVLPITLIATDSLEIKEEIKKVIKNFDLSENENWAFSDADPASLRRSIDEQWYGELPRQYIFREGEKTAKSGVFSKADLQGWLSLAN